MSIVSTLLLFFLWWEALSSARTLIGLNIKGLFIDLKYKLPSTLHTHNEVPAVSESQ